MTTSKIYTIRNIWECECDDNDSNDDNDDDSEYDNDDDSEYDSTRSSRTGVTFR